MPHILATSQCSVNAVEQDQSSECLPLQMHTFNNILPFSAGSPFLVVAAFPMAFCFVGKAPERQHWPTQEPQHTRVPVLLLNQWFWQSDLLSNYELPNRYLEKVSLGFVELHADERQHLLARLPIRIIYITTAN